MQGMYRMLSREGWRRLWLLRTASEQAAACCADRDVEAVSAFS